MFKKRLWMAIGIFVVYCILLIVISASNKNNIITNAGIEAESGITVGSTLPPEKWENYQVTIKNASKTDDNPWKTTAGIIRDEEFGESIFLTPDTEACVNLNGVDEKLELQMKIHPRVAQASDGVVVHISYLDKQRILLSEQSIELNNTGEYVFVVDKQRYKQCTDLEIQCRAGADNNSNSDADWLMINKVYNNNSTFSSHGYVRSATYFGDEWPINFWNSEMDHLIADLQQIKGDGFDSIIVCIPWKEFQICIEPITYSFYAFEQLEKIMNAAQTIGLGVYTRISYTHDFWNDSNEFINDRFINLLYNESAREAWMRYAEKLYSQLSKHESFRGGFITWEDFWGILSICDIESEKDRIQLADSTGYQSWVFKKYQLADYNTKYDTAYDDYSRIPIPRRNELAMESMYEFYDDFLNGLLQQAQKNVFPNLSNEVRLDADPVFDSIGNVRTIYKHTSTFACEGADFVATMYGIPMGFENNGERVTAHDAIIKTEYILNMLKTQNKGKPVYVDQFIFYDNTPQFAHNAKLIDEEVDDYLRLVADVLIDYSDGYGIWTYRDYYNNMIFNNGFYLENVGWNCIGDVKFEQVNASSSAHLDAGQGISQDIGGIRNHFDSNEYVFCLDVVQCNNAGSLEIRIGDYEKTLDVTGTGKYEITFPKTDSFDISIMCEEGSYNIDNLRMYSFVQNGYLYSPDNEELLYLDSVRELNEQLSNKRGM